MEPLVISKMNNQIKNICWKNKSVLVNGELYYKLMSQLLFIICIFDFFLLGLRELYNCTFVMGIFFFGQNLNVKLKSSFLTPLYHFKTYLTKFTPITKYG